MIDASRYHGRMRPRLRRNFAPPIEAMMKRRTTNTWCSISPRPLIGKWISRAGQRQPTRLLRCRVLDLATVSQPQQRSGKPQAGELVGLISPHSDMHGLTAGRRVGWGSSAGLSTTCEAEDRISKRRTDMEASYPVRNPEPEQQQEARGAKIRWRPSDDLSTHARTRRRPAPTRTSAPCDAIQQPDE